MRFSFEETGLLSPKNSVEAQQLFLDERFYSCHLPQKTRRPPSLVEIHPGELGVLIGE